MAIAALVFGLVVGFFHFQGSAVPADTISLASEPEAPARYVEVHRASTTEKLTPTVKTLAAGGRETVVVVPVFDGVDGLSPQEMAQRVADEVADKPSDAARIISAALARAGGDSTLGDIATLAAAATRAAPDQAAAVAGAVTRSLADRPAPVIAAAVATIISLVPEQTRDIGLVVGGILGADVETLGMIAQTVAIATGEASFESLSESSGVSMGELMRASAGFGVDVPFDVPAYAAQLAPGPGMVADSDSGDGEGDAEEEM